MRDLIGGTESAGWLHLLAFAVMILPMNLLAGGAVIAAFTATSRGGNAARLGEWLSASLSGAVAWTIAAGASALWIRGRMAGSSGAKWPVIEIALLLAACAIAHGFDLRSTSSRGRSAVRSVLAIAAAGVVVLCASGTGRGPSRFADPVLLPRSLHMLLAAIAVSGIFVALHGLRSRRADAAYGNWAMRHGLRWFVVPTAVQMVVGFAFLLSLPSPIRSHFLGGSPAATAELAAGILLAIAAFIAATHATHAADPERGVIAGSTLLGATLLAMILLREQLAAAPVPVDPAIVRSETLGAAEPVFLAAALMIIAGGMSRWILRRLAALPAGRADRATPGAPSQRPTGSAEPS